MTPSEVVRAWFDAHARGDIDAARALMASDAVVHAPEEDLAGFDEFLDWYARRPPARYRLDELLEGDGRAVALITLSGASGDWRQVAEYVVRDARIAEILVFEGVPARGDNDLEVRAAAFQRCIETRDGEAAEALLHEDYALVLAHPAPARMPRARWLEVLEDYAVHEYTVLERFVDVDGDLAAILQRVHQRATVLGQDRSGTMAITDVWRRGGQGWQLWRRHSTPLSAGPMPGA